MASRKPPDDPKGPPPGKPPPDEPGGPERPRHQPAGREHQVHREILDRRMRGGRKPTPEDYRKGLEQWKKIPGSIVRPPTDITPPEDEPKDDEPNEDKGDQS